MPIMIKFWSPGGQVDMEEKGRQVKQAIQKIIMKWADLPHTPPPTPLNTLTHAHSQGKMKHTSQEINSALQNKLNSMRMNVGLCSDLYVPTQGPFHHRFESDTW